MYFELKNKNEIKIFYNAHGYVVIKNFFKKNHINSIKKKIVSNIKKKKNNFFYYEKINRNKKKLRRIEKITEYSKEAKKTIYSKEILNFINFLNNKKNIIFKDKLNFKYPGGEGYLPHIDGHFYWKDKNNKMQNGWNLYANSFTNFVIPLEKSNVENGCLYVSNKKNTKILGNNWKKITDNLIKNTPNIKKKYLNKFKFKPAILERIVWSLLKLSVIPSEPVFKSDIIFIFLYKYMHIIMMSSILIKISQVNKCLNDCCILNAGDDDIPTFPAPAVLQVLLYTPIPPNNDNRINISNILVDA